MNEKNIDFINEKLEELNAMNALKTNDERPGLNDLKYYLKNILKYSNKLEGHLERISNDIELIDLIDLQKDEELCKKIKRGNLYLSWINEHFDYFENENNNNFYYKNSYKRKDIIKINFGFNVGSELGGLHYAVVVEKDNSMHDSTLVVVPLSTFRKKKRNMGNLRPTEIDLGVIDDLNENGEKLYSYAVIDQIRLISKARIYEPRSNKDLPAILSNDQMDLIDTKIIHFFSKKNINPVDHFDELDNIISEYIVYKQLGDKYEECLLKKLDIIYEKIFN